MFKDLLKQAEKYSLTNLLWLTLLTLSDWVRTEMYQLDCT